MREDHPAANVPRSLDSFCLLDHALISFDGSFAGATDQALAAVGRKRRVVLSVSSILVLPTVLRSTDLIAVTPARFAVDVPGLVVRGSPIPIQGFTVSAVWHERSHLDPARSWSRSLLIRTCDRLGQGVQRS
jgi:DNA-binding transcriptional LysR family regulator